jgi:hypothetical protein
MHVNERNEKLNDKRRNLGNHQGIIHKSAKRDGVSNPFEFRNFEECFPLQVVSQQKSSAVGQLQSLVFKLCFQFLNLLCHIELNCNMFACECFRKDLHA